MFDLLRKQWNKIFDNYLEKQGETVIFYVKNLPVGTGVDQIWHSPLDYSGIVLDDIIQYEIQGIVFRDLYGSKTTESESFVVEQVGNFEPGDVVVQAKIEEIDNVFGGAIPVERVKYVTLSGDIWREKYIVRDVVPRGLGSPPYIVDIFLRKTNKKDWG